ncbi:MAG: polyhydroxyalkanoate depolymerase [Hyphomicrobiaceae bacterium]
MQYAAYEAAHVMVAPWRMAARAIKFSVRSPFNPFGWTPQAKQIAAACDVFESVTRRYGKPEWGIETTRIFGLEVPVKETTVLSKPFCNLLHFERDVSVAGHRTDPKVLIIAPMSGHYATLLRGTVAAMLPEHDVYITDWVDARDVPLYLGSFDLNDFIDYLVEFYQFLGPNLHVIAVCQPAVPALAATAYMARNDMQNQPNSLTLMGGPIDTRRNPTQVNKLAEDKPLSWFKSNVIARVPFPNMGFMREVYPGFVQLTGFMTMNLERHTRAHLKLFDNLVKGDKDSVQQHREFYEEYLAVMDLPAEFYLQTVNAVFQQHLLPKGKMMHRGERIDPSAIRKTALMTVEGERDDICGLGQTEAAQSLCPNVPIDERYHYVQPGVGHYGVFNGTRWRTEIQPRIREMIRSVEFKRKTGNASVVGLPYRALKSSREVEIDWTQTEFEIARQAASPNEQPRPAALATDLNGMLRSPPRDQGATSPVIPQQPPKSVLNSLGGDEAAYLNGRVKPANDVGVQLPQLSDDDRPPPTRH